MTTTALYPGMTEERYFALQDTKGDAKLTPEEIRFGWHFCPDWDFLLIHRDDPEAKGCCCGFIKHSPYEQQ